MNTLRRGSEAYYQDLAGDWIKCKVMHVSSSGSPSRDIVVTFVTRQYSNNGLLKIGVVLQRPAFEVVPATAMKILPYGWRKEGYVCQETFPGKQVNRGNQTCSGTASQ